MRGEAASTGVFHAPEQSGSAEPEPEPKRYWTYATTLAGVYLSVGFLFDFAAKE